MKTWQRILLFVSMYICVLVLPWWLTVIVLAGLTIYLHLYLEVVFFGFLFDTLYATKYSNTFFHFGLLSATVFLLLVMFVKTKIRT